MHTHVGTYIYIYTLWVYYVSASAWVCAWVSLWVDMPASTAYAQVRTCMATSNSAWMCAGM